MTEWQRRLLADPYRLEGEADVAWELRPELLLKAGLATIAGGLERGRVDRLMAEIERGLRATRPELLKWLCDKLCALPTQNGSGLNAAIWADNVIDVCGHYPEDLLQTATLELLRSETFRPSPAKIVAVIEPRWAERQRMLARAKSLIAPKGAAAPPTEKPLATRLERLKHTRSIYERMGKALDVIRLDREIAQEEGRLAGELRNCENLQAAVPPERPPFTPAISPTAQRCAEIARARHTGQPAPEWRDIPEAV
jgi:hypothetical protein